MRTAALLTLVLGVSVSVPVWASEESLMTDEAVSAGADGEAYAQIDQVSVGSVGDAEVNQWEVILTGTFQHSCQQLKDVKVIDAGDSFEVLPLLSREPRSWQCLPALTPFETSVLLPADLEEGRYRVHVRSRERSFSEVITVGSSD